MKIREYYTHCTFLYHLYFGTEIFRDTIAPQNTTIFQSRPYK
jgi:hypothetical protein